MQMGVVNSGKFRITPNRRFWEYDLELPIERLMDEYSNPNLRQSWLESLSPRQITMLYTVNQVDTDVSKALPVTQMRKALMEQSDDLFNYYLVNRFNHAKLETAVSDIAKATLSDDLLEFCLVKNNKYDKKSLLFALFNQNPDALKNIYHYDKIHKKGFAAFVLLNPPRQQTKTFADFISSYPIAKILEQYDLNLCEVFECLSKFNKEKSSLGTFVDQIITRRSNNMIQRRLSIKRGGRTTTISLDIVDDFGVAMVDKIPDPHERNLDFVIDVAQALGAVPEPWREFATLLQTHTITEVASLTGKSRAAIYRILEQLRPCFIDLLPYLNQVGHTELETGIKPSTKGEAHD